MIFNLFIVFLAPISSTAFLLPPKYESLHGLLSSGNAETYPSCDCKDTNSSGPPVYPPAICNDVRLGPVDLPQKLPLLSLVSKYDRFGGSTPGQWLFAWTDPEDESKWAYPPKDGFILDTKGNPTKATVILEKGTKLDRFGAEGGRFLGAADAPFDQRSLPPDSLIPAANKMVPFNYHVYTVLKNLTVEAGPIAPWFGQPGFGTQFFTGANNISMLVEMGFLERELNIDIVLGPGEGGGCGL